ncbi:MAG: DUF2478 domain-containing protein [Alphaproteobacteria bacterium]|jgi:hypothetical protein|nr:DUF2478 domain-containing protein [Alphaproteobacteria bacterium]
MIGYITAAGRGVSDRIMVDVSETLAARGLRLAGAVQHNPANPSGRRCHMDLHVLGSGQVVRISQELGPHALACRLNASALAQVVGLVEHQLALSPQLLVLNKFATQEVEGRGWRPAIGAAVAAGIPVLLAVNDASLPAFHAYAGDLAEALSPDPAAMCDWAVARAPRA